MYKGFIFFIFLKFVNIALVFHGYAVTWLRFSNKIGFVRLYFNEIIVSFLQYFLRQLQHIAFRLLISDSDLLAWAAS